MSPTHESHVIEVYADIGCPFAHVGLRRFVEHRERIGRPDVLLRVRAWPLELVNGEPLDPAFIAEEVDEIRDQVAEDLFAGFEQRSLPPSTISALAAVERTYEVSDTDGERISLALRDALFEQGRAIGEPDVLRSVVAECGIEHDQAFDDGDDREVAERSRQSGVARGVTGSPHFFVGRDDFFCPALDIERVDGHLQIGTDRAAWDRFLDAAFTDHG